MENFDIKMFIQKFMDEANILLNELENNLLELEKDNQNQDLIEAVFRAMHTLKGISSMYGYNEISHYTHSLETIFDSIRSKSLLLSSDIFDLTFRSADHLRKLLNDIDLVVAENIVQHSKLTTELKSLTEKYAVATKEVLKNTKEFEIFQDEIRQMASWQIIFRVSEDLMNRAVNILYLFEDLAKLGDFYIEKGDWSFRDTEPDVAEYWEIMLLSECKKDEIEEIFIFVLDDCKIINLTKNDIFEFAMNGSNQKISAEDDYRIIDYILGNPVGEEHSSTMNVAPNLAKSNIPANQNQAAKKQNISVSAEKLDKLMFIVSEMVTLKSEMQNAGDKHDLDLIMSKIYKLDKLTKQLRNVTLSARLVPFSELTLKFKRLVRDLSQSLGKKIELTTEGNEVELDTNLISALADPLLHLIRNCIDHGIESPVERAASQKAEQGTIKLNSFQSGNYVYIQISDDGMGLDLDKIRAKAIEKGIISAQNTLTDKEISDLIFLPGFSTSDQLTEISGRGVGMDVVTRRIAELRGEISLETQKGEGTTFTIKLKQTISIMDTLLIQAGESFFAIPIDEIENCHQEYHQIIAQQHNLQIVTQNELLPFLYLREIFKIGKFPPPEKEKIIVIKKQNQKFAIIADLIIGQYQAVIKPMGESYVHKDYIMGASIMGDGNLAIVLDTFKLIHN